MNKCKHLRVNRQTMPTQNICVNFTETFRLQRELIAKFNSTAPTLSIAIRPAHQQLIQILTKFYAAWLIDVEDAHSIDFSKPFLIRTNNVALSNRMHCAPRSIQNYIQRLTSCGFILSKKFRGTNASYELYLNPSWLLVSGVENHFLTATKNKSEVTENEDITKGIRKTLPLNERLELKRNLNNNYNTVESCGKIRNNKTGHDKGIHPSEKAKRYYEKVEKLRRATEFSTRDDKEFYAQILWRQAKTSLYKDQSFTSFDEKRFIDLIQLFYENKRGIQLGIRHRELSRRVQIACDYASKKSLETGKQFQFYYPTTYFDPSCDFGFSKTESWLKNQKIYNRIKNSRNEEKINRFRKRTIVEKHINHYLRVLKGDLPQCSLMGTFRNAKKQIEQLGDETLTREFLTRVAFA